MILCVNNIDHQKVGNRNNLGPLCSWESMAQWVPSEGVFRTAGKWQLHSFGAVTLNEAMSVVAGPDASLCFQFKHSINKKENITLQ